MHHIVLISGSGARIWYISVMLGEGVLCAKYDPTLFMRHRMTDKVTVATEQRGDQLQPVIIS